MALGWFMPRPLLRRWRCLAVLLCLGLLTACGFQLRTSQKLPFETIAITPERAAGVAGDLARYLGDVVRPLAPGRAAPAPDVVMDITQEVRQKVIAGINASGQVREFELRLKVVFRVRTPQGVTLIADTPIEQIRNISFNESAVLSKEAEETLLYRDMQADIVQQLVRRLVAMKFKPAVHAEPAAAPLAAASAPLP